MEVIKADADDMMNVGRSGSVTGIVEFEENFDNLELTNADPYHLMYSQGVGIDNIVFDMADNVKDELSVDVDNSIVSYSNANSQ